MEVEDIKALLRADYSLSDDDLKECLKLCDR